jgi:hypothetical protein
MPRMIVNRRLPLYNGIDIGNCNKDLYGPLRHCLSNGKLVQIAGLVVVNGTPTKVSEVTDQSADLRDGLADSIELGMGLWRKIGKKTSVKHSPAGNALQNRTMPDIV